VDYPNTGRATDHGTPLAHATGEAARRMERAAEMAEDLIAYLREEAQYLRTGEADGEQRGYPEALQEYLRASIASRVNEVSRFAGDATAVLKEGSVVSPPAWHNRPQPF
jgi:hypothetical protein